MLPHDASYLRSQSLCCLLKRRNVPLSFAATVVDTIIGTRSNLKLKVHGGTIRNDQPALCRSCKYATWAIGSNGDAVRDCGQVSSVVQRQLPHHIVSCSAYLNKYELTANEYKEIAWVVRSGGNKNKIGFSGKPEIVPYKDLPSEEKFHLDDDEY